MTFYETIKDKKGENMEVPNRIAGIEPVRIGLDNEFSFKCHKGVECFTKCCSDINVILTPYDIIRLKNRLRLSSEEFLALYTRLQLLEKTDLPVVALRPLDDDSKLCPFVKKDGCIIYKDRPTACRYYPLGTASLSHKDGGDDDGFYFFVNEPHCLGFEEKKEWTVREWRKDQGVDIYDKVNAAWTDLIVRKRSFPPNIKLTEHSKKMFFLVCYNIDKFRQFVFESSFLTLYDIEDETVEMIRADEAALLEFGCKWLKWLLYKDGNFKIDREAAALRRRSS